MEKPCATRRKAFVLYDREEGGYSGIIYHCHDDGDDFHNDDDRDQEDDIVNEEFGCQCSDHPTQPTSKKDKAKHEDVYEKHLFTT